MSKIRGYDKELMILPFDHRTSFQKKMFGFGATVSEEEAREVASYKNIIFEGFEKAVSSGLPREKMGILVDEQFGTEVISAAKRNGFTVCVAAEKSGQDEFDFEYGADYQKHIEAVDPHFVKVLVRMNTEGDAELNQRQAARLAELGRYLDSRDRGYIFELLVPATEAQLKNCGGDKGVYDREVRPGLMVKGVEYLQDAGVEADVWKLEGLDRKEDYDAVCKAARRNGRDKVGVIVLGRGENDEKVLQWLSAGANVDGVIGFAVGRTVFFQALKNYREKKITREEAVQHIANNYMRFCNHWLEARG